ncbi:MAG: hypothetical protein CM15mP6_0450 [Methanobacteriota archaeon]|nr:MAG: hypothetical protein CM15mP6_0450 [Euryarchaeota archaeon]
MDISERDNVGGLIKGSVLTNDGSWSEWGLPSDLMCSRTCPYFPVAMLPKKNPSTHPGGTGGPFLTSSPSTIRILMAWISSILS